MKKIILLAVAASLLSGCVVGQPMSRREAEETRSAYRGAAMQQALQNAHDAAWGQGVYRQQEHRDSARHHHNHN